MMTQYYHFAGICVAVSMPVELFYEDAYRLTPFQTDERKPDYTFSFEQTEQLSAPEGKIVTDQPGMHCYAAADHSIRYIGVYTNTWSDASVRVEYRGNICRAEVKPSKYGTHVPIKHVLAAMAAEHLIARNDGFVFHCSYIEHNGKAILFTAPSQTGKSTQAELWSNHRGARIINGDRAAVREVGGVLMAEGIPFAGSSKYCVNRSLPIEAIVYLGQAPRTSIRKMTGYEAFSRIWEGISVNTWDKEDMERVSAVVQQVAARIPVYHMPCTPDESAVIALEEALRKQV